MNIGRIRNIKKTFLDKKEILNVKDFSYAPLSKDSLDKAIGVLSAVSSALFIANVTMNTTTKMDNSNEDYITEQELIKILETKIKPPLGPYYEKYVKSCLNNSGLLKKELVPYVLKLIEPARQEVPHHYIVENVKDSEGNLQPAILDWYNSEKNNMNKWAISELFRLLKDSNGICDPKVLTLFRKYEDSFHRYNFPQKEELEFCKNPDGTFSQEKINAIAKCCRRTHDYHYISGAIDTDGNLDERLLSRVLFMKDRWGRSSLDYYYDYGCNELSFRKMLPYITQNGKYSEEIIDIISSRSEAVKPEDIIDMCEHIYKKYGEIKPEYLCSFMSTFGFKDYVDILKEADLSTPDCIEFINSLRTNEHLFNPLHLLLAYVQTDSSQDHEFLKTMLNDVNLSERIMEFYAQDLGFGAQLYNSSLPDEYLYHKLSAQKSNFSVEEFDASCEVDDNNLEALLENLQYQLSIAEFFSAEGPYESYEKHPEKFNSIKNLKTQLLNYDQFFGKEEGDYHSWKDRFDWFVENYVLLLNSIDYIDNVTLDYLLYCRFDVVDNHDHSIEKFLSLSKDEKELYNNLINPTNNGGNDFTTKEKVGFINILAIHKTHNIPMDFIYKMVEDGNVDVAKIKTNLCKRILQEYGFETKNISAEQIAALDVNYIPLFAKFVSENNEIPICEDLITGMCSPDFKKYIQKTSSKYKKINSEVQKLYKQNSLNYDLWFNPRKGNEVKFVTIDDNKDQLRQISNQIMEDMNSLMQTPAKGFIEKQFKEYVKDGVFVIPEKVYSNKKLIKELVENLANDTEKGQLYQIWKRAKDNSISDDIEKVARAKNVLTVQNHLEQRLKDIGQISTDESAKEFDWTIKMWDRNPVKDLFQGNYSTCCIGVGEENEEYMNQYLLNTTFNMIEITDNKTGDTVGNALCYFGIANSKPIFIIDNI